jgi:hypothetical protein
MKAGGICIKSDNIIITQRWFFCQSWIRGWDWYQSEERVLQQKQKQKQNTHKNTHTHTQNLFNWCLLLRECSMREDDGQLQMWPAESKPKLKVWSDENLASEKAHWQVCIPHSTFCSS